MSKNVNYEQLNKQFFQEDAFTRQRYAQFFRHLPAQPGIILDVGCGPGIGAEVLRSLKKGLVLWGLDCIRDYAEQTSKLYDSFHYGSATSIPLQEKEVDVILAGEFIEHLAVEDVDLVLKEFYRVLKPGGCILLTTPNPGFFKHKLLNQSVLGGHHLSEHWAPKLRAKIESLGFVRTRIRGSGKMSLLLGERFPLLAFYGSYLLIATKPE